MPVTTITIELADTAGYDAERLGPIVSAAVVAGGRVCVETTPNDAAPKTSGPTSPRIPARAATPS